MTKPDVLWVKVLKAKYRCGNDVYSFVMDKKSSMVWKSINTVWDRFTYMISRKICHGCNTKAWWDLWSLLEKPLVQYVDKNHHLLDPRASMATFLNHNGDWNYREMIKFLPLWVVEKIMMIK